MTDDILQLAEHLLGTHIGKINRRGWATFWCPFHDDEKQAGTTGLPNFGVNVDAGNWNCFRCGQKGGSIRSLYEALGEDFEPRGVDYSPAFSKKRKARVAVSEVDRLDEAITDTRAHVISSPAMAYLHSPALWLRLRPKNPLCIQSRTGSGHTFRIGAFPLLQLVLGGQCRLCRPAHPTHSPERPLPAR